MNSFFKFFSLFLTLPLLGLRAEVHLDRLFEYDQQTCAETLQAAELPNLWSYFLKGQANLYFSQDKEWLSQKRWWIEARNILELGSGNGVYLSLLSETFKNKAFWGVENQSLSVEQSNAQFGRSGLAFIEGDAEVEYEQYKNQFDAILSVDARKPSPLGLG